MKDKFELKDYIPKLVEFIKKEVTDAGKTGCIVGVSGGIDSAVVTCLCKMAFPDTTYGLFMPMEDNVNGLSHNRGKELCETKAIAEFLRPIKDIDKHTNLTDKAKGNFYARQRMAELYLCGEMNDCLVVGTDNKSENFIGYFTKYGDGGVDINPIGEFYKSEVYELGRLLGVPESILNAKPTAELWNGQTDEDELGMSYDDIDNAIKIYENVYWDGGAEVMKNITDANFPVMKKVAHMHIASEHKRSTPNEYRREDDD